MTDTVIVSNETQTLLSEKETVTVLTNSSGGSTSVVVTQHDSVIVTEEQVTNVMTIGVQGPSGPKGDTVLVSAISPKPTGEPVPAFRAVILDEAGIAFLADHTNLDHMNAVYGVTLESAVQGEPVGIQAFGEVSNPTWNWTPRALIFLGLDGELTQDTIDSGFLLPVGRAISGTLMFVNVGQAVVL